MAYKWAPLCYVLVLGHIFLTTRLVESEAGATGAQISAAGQLMRDACLGRFPKVTVEMADQIKDGNLIDEKDAKCYMNCVLEIMQSIKKGKFLFESTLKQVDTLVPDVYKEEYRNAINGCKDSTNGIKDHCEAAFSILTCIRGKTSVFIFP